MLYYIVLLLWVCYSSNGNHYSHHLYFLNITNSVKQWYLILRWENLYVSGSSPDFPTNYGEVAQGGRAAVVRQIQISTHTIFFSFLKKIAKLYRTECPYMATNRLDEKTVLKTVSM